MSCTSLIIIISTINDEVMMKISIKRGAKEIGGSAIEISADNGQRIILDLGLPLDAEKNAPELLPQIDGLKNKTDDLLAVLISHAHQDHYGLGKYIDKSIPVYLSKEAATIMKVAAEHHLPEAFEFENCIHFYNGKKFMLGSFAITPYLFDHSAYGAYGFLIEADGKKVFYSGDFRAHGRKRKLFYKFLQNKPEDIDVLLLEGTCLGREHIQHFEYEEDLEDKFTDFWNNTKGLALVQSSAQNIDRIVTIYRAAKRNGRILVLSAYAGHILWATGNKKLPNFTWKDVKKLTDFPQRPHEINIEEISQNPQKYVLLLDYRISQKLKINNVINSDTSYVYSMWNGYKEKYQNWLAYLTDKNVPMTDIHTSGHADIHTLKRLVKSLNPKLILPMHTFHPQEFKNLFDNVFCADDGEVITL